MKKLAIEKTQFNLGKNKQKEKLKKFVDKQTGVVQTLE